MTDWARKLKLLKNWKRLAALGLWGLVAVYLFVFFPMAAFFELSPGLPPTNKLQRVVYKDRDRAVYYERHYKAQDEGGSFVVQLLS